MCGASDIATAAGACAGFIAAFYLWKAPRLNAWYALWDLHAAATEYRYDRNEIENIKKRVVSFSAAVLCSTLYLEVVLRREGGAGPSISGSLFVDTYVLSRGQPHVAMRAVAQSVAATVALLLGSIYEQLVLDPASLISSLVDVDLLWLRNVVICPIGEEIFFRALLFHVFRARTMPLRVILSAALFSVSHAHHVLHRASCEYSSIALHTSSALPEPQRRRLSYRRAFEAARVQCVTTLLFGLISGTYFATCCRENILATAVAHSICNIVGEPPLALLSPASPVRRLVSAVVHVAGVVGFVLLLRR